MISILICSRSSTLREHIQQNVSQTIGDLPFEIITIINEENTYSLFEAYNLAAAKATYPLLCFVHEDITIQTKGWGRLVADLMVDKNIGVLGLAGAVYKSEIPSPWWFSSRLETLNISYVVQQEKKFAEQSGKGKIGDSKLERVVVVDGVWLCCRKEFWEQNQFDQFSYTGFHFYDLDFCMQAYAKGYANYITNCIIVEHQSTGCLNKEWTKAALGFHRKWKDYLPASVVKVSHEEKAAIQKEMVENWLINLNRYNREDLSNWYVYWIRYFFIYPLRRKTYSLIYHRIKSSIG